MIVKEMKASELDKGLKVVDPSSSSDDDDDHSYYIPPQRIPVYEAYQKVSPGLFERTIHDRTWDWWISVVTSDPVKNQEINKFITQLYRIKVPTDGGKEWLYYNLDMSGYDWKGNRKDWTTLEGVIDGMPVLNYEIEPSTNKIIPGTTQVLEIKREYTIPFSRSRVEELSKFCKAVAPCIVIAPDGRKYSVSLEQFKSLGYNELIDMVTGYADYMKNRRGQKVYS
jgi:hypothetical protein